MTDKRNERVTPKRIFNLESLEGNVKSLGRVLYDVVERAGIEGRPSILLCRELHVPDAIRSVFLNVDSVVVSRARAWGPRMRDLSDTLRRIVAEDFVHALEGDTLGFFKGEGKRIRKANQEEYNEKEHEPGMRKYAHNSPRMVHAPKKKYVPALMLLSMNGVDRATTNWKRQWSIHSSRQS